MMRHIYRPLVCLVALYSCVSWGMVFDNRYLPLYQKPFTRRIDAPSHFRIQPFFMRGDRAEGDFEDINIPDIDGKYNQAEIARALVLSGRLGANPFRSDLQGITTIDWRREGRIDAQGIAFLYEQAFPCNFSAGLSFLFIHVNSLHEFCLDNSSLNVLPGDRQYLFSLKDSLHEQLGVTPPLFSKVGFGDIDFYLRWGLLWDYVCKFRRIDTGIKLGLLAPTETEIPVDNPAAIPFGGGKFWGIYTQLEGEFELKEDWNFGVAVRASKRFARTLLSRMPVSLEPTRYGAVIGNFNINPGWTFVFNPYVSFEGLREGFGVKVLYTLVAHLEDKISDRRADQTLPINLAPVGRRSSWGMEHVTVGAFYDFAKYRDCRTWYLPTISLYWDIPVDWLVSKRTVRTNAVSLMIETDF